jgi:hypothetical protein
VNPVREDPNRASVRRNPTCSFSGADDGIRTRDPHLGNRMAIVSCVSARLSSAPELHVLGAPVSSVSPNSWRRLHFVGDFVGADAPTDERVKGRSSSPADSRARLGSVLIRPELEFVAGKRAWLGGELLLQDSAPVSCLTLILWPVHSPPSAPEGRECTDAPHARTPLDLIESPDRLGGFVGRPAHPAWERSWPMSSLTSSKTCDPDRNLREDHVVTRSDGGQRATRRRQAGRRTRRR